MGKKVRKKAHSGHKEKRVSTPSQRTVAQQNIANPEVVDDAVSVVKERKVCAHIDKGFDLVKVSSKMRSIKHIRCEDCREGVVDRRASKGKGKQGKKKGGGSMDTNPDCKALWVCLECGHFSCGGIGFPTTPQSHALRHARQTRHPLAIQFENLQLRWCFPCSTLIPVEKLEDSGEQKDLLSDIVKLIKGRSTQGSSVDVEDVWFGSGSVTSAITSENTSLNSLDVSRGYAVRGLVNLGNSCFFNSVMQNLLAMDRLRHQLSEVDESIGPLTDTLKQLFIETTPEAGLRNVINPKSFFGSVCAKAPQFRGYQQHDSHELLRSLLDSLSTEELSAKKQTTWENGISTDLSPTFVDAIFGGQLSSTVSCLECGHSSTVFEPFLDLSLPVPTKKPQSKKANPISRAKKPKLPPKKSGRIRPKGNKDGGAVASESVSVLSAGVTSSCNAESSVPIAEIVGDASENSTPFESIDQCTLAEKKRSVSTDLTTAEEFEEQPFPKNVTDKTEASLDNSTWLDYLESGPVLNDHATGSENVTDKAEASVDSSTWLDYLEPDHESNVTDKPFDNLTWLDYLEPDLVSNDHDIASKANSATSSFENELPSLVQGSEVLLLPYKEEISTSGEMLRGEGEVSSSAVGCEPDALDFDGFGELFNEPEIVAGPSVKPSSSDNSFQANEITDAGFLVGNNSESDPGEVDNSDSPVSIDSCLAYFTKPELLSNEHAWHCENCSKSLQERKMRLRIKQQKGTSKFQTSGVEDRISNALSSSTKECPCPGEVRSQSNGDIKKDVLCNFDGSLMSENQNYKEKTTQKAETISAISQLEGNDEVNDTVTGMSQSSSCSKASSQVSISGEATDSCTVNEHGKVGSDPDDAHQMRLQLLPGGSESEGSEREEMNSESSKVKRDATKRILIDRAPPILTIHLKRFSQDLRGRLSKLNGHVDFRDTIDLRPYMDPRCAKTDEYKFRLVGVVEHLGTMRGGHYIAYVRGAGKSDNRDFVWYHVSDAYVREVSLEEVLRSDAYILFYERI